MSQAVVQFRDPFGPFCLLRMFEDKLCGQNERMEKRRLPPGIFIMPEKTRDLLILFLTSQRGYGLHDSLHFSGGQRRVGEIGRESASGPFWLELT